MFKNHSLKKHFRRHGYVVVRAAYDMSTNAGELSKMYQYSLSAPKSDPDEQVPGAPAHYSDVNMNKILIRMMPVLERVTGKHLFPTYSYFRVYNSGSVLPRHTDRAACEISCSMHLGRGSDHAWPLWVRDRSGKEVPVKLEPGDCLVYSGCELEHWRDMPEQSIEEFSQVFLHYVDQNGPYANAILDNKI